MALNSDGIGVARSFQPGSSEPTEQLVDCEECQVLALEGDSHANARMWAWIAVIAVLILVVVVLMGGLNGGS